MTGPLLSVDINVDYPDKPGVLRNAAFELDPGEVLGLVGESGSGKSTLALAILRLLTWRGGRMRGRILFRGRDLAALPEREMRRVRGREVSLVQQDPISSLNPALRLRTQLNEAWRAHEPFSRDTWAGRVGELMRSVSLPDDGDFLRLYPRQLSVGMAQRMVIAMAVLHRPSLLIADEPTSALDVITQAEILRLFARLSAELGMAILFISHDLVSVASICHRVAIMHRGEIVETGRTSRIYNDPVHPYTRELIAALPQPPASVDDSKLPL
jgi:ABC-type glutathione transport system ATPase component